MPRYSPRKERERRLQLYGRVLDEDQVSHPRLDGMTEKVIRTFDVVDWMYRRKQLTERQFRAVEYFRNAHEALGSEVGNTMDFDRVRGVGLPGQPPTKKLLWASLTIAGARQALDADQHSLLTQVVLGRATLERIVQGNSQQRPRWRDVKRLSAAFQKALDVLADFWWPETAGRSSGRILSFLMDDARPVLAVAGVMEMQPRAYIAGR